MRTIEAIELFMKSREARGLSPDTLRWYRGTLESFGRQCGDLPEEPEPIYDFLSSRNVGDERRHGYYRALRTLYSYLDRRFDASPNPMRFVEPPKRRHKQPRPITPEDLEHLLSFPHSSGVKAALLFLADTGARVGELVNLKPSNLSQTPYGYIAEISGKTGTRLVPISTEIYLALMKALPFGYSKYRMRRLISKAFKDARVQGSGINLRHTFGTLWAGDELILQRIMGHAHLSTTKIYRALRMEQLSEQHHKYSPLKMILGSTRRMEL